LLARLTVWVLTWVLTTLCVAHPAVAYVCGMDGRARPSCCCKPTADPPAQDDARLRRPGCCEVVEWAAPGPAVSLVVHDVSSPLVADALHATLELGLPPLRARRGLPSTARGPPHERGPPAYLRHCSLLI